MYLTCQLLGEPCRQTAVDSLFDSLQFENQAHEVRWAGARFELNQRPFDGLDPGRNEPIIPCLFGHP